MLDFLRPGLVAGLHRRTFLGDIGLGFTGLALGAMLAADGIVRADEHAVWQPPDGKPHLTPRAKSVVWLFMNGGVSHAESFDLKPEMTKYAGKSISETPDADTQNPERLKRREVAFNVELRQKLYPLQVGIRRYGTATVGDWHRRNQLGWRT